MDKQTFRHLGHLRVQADALERAGLPIAAFELRDAASFFEARENSLTQDAEKATARERERCVRAVHAGCGDEIIERGLVEAIENGEQWRLRDDGHWYGDHEA